MTVELVVDDTGLFEPADVHVGQRLTALREETDERVALAVAFVVRALRGGSVCVDLNSAELEDLADAVRASPLLADPPILRLNGDLLYLDRYWLEEQQVCDDILAMVKARPAQVSPDIDRLFPTGFEEQRAAAKVALSQGLTVLTGGPGTGKTTTVARLLACCHAAGVCGSRWRRLRARRPRGCRRRCSWRLASWRRRIKTRSQACMRRRCTGCWAAGRTRRRGSGTIAVIGCRMT